MAGGRLGRVCCSGGKRAHAPGAVQRPWHRVGCVGEHPQHHGRSPLQVQLVAGDVVCHSGVAAQRGAAKARAAKGALGRGAWRLGRRLGGRCGQQQRQQREAAGSTWRHRSKAGLGWCQAASGSASGPWSSGRGAANDAALAAATAGRWQPAGALREKEALQQALHNAAWGWRGGGRDHGVYLAARC